MEGPMEAYMHDSKCKLQLFAALQLADPTDPTGHRVQTGVHTSQKRLM